MGQQTALGSHYGAGLDHPGVSSRLQPLQPLQPRHLGTYFTRPSTAPAPLATAATLRPLCLCARTVSDTLHYSGDWGYGCLSITVDIISCLSTISRFFCFLLFMAAPWSAPDYALAATLKLCL